MGTPPAPQDVDAELRSAVEAGREADFTHAPWNRPSMPADLVRQLVLGDSAGSGVRIRGAVIEGLLDLADARGPGGDACNALILTDCELRGGAAAAPVFDASHGHLRRLSIVDCRAGGIELSGALIDGDLNLDGIGSRYGGPDCWVKARHARVAGSVTARRARLALPWPVAEDGAPATRWEPDGDEPYWRDVPAPYALDLTGSEIAGSLILRPQFESLAGVTVRGATIGGTFDAAGALIIAAAIGRSTDALDAQYARVRGAVVLSQDPDLPELGDGGFKSRGSLWFYGAEIGGALDLRGASVSASAESDALGLASVSLSGSLLMMPSDGGLQCRIATADLGGMAVGGHAHIEGAIERVVANRLTVGGDLTLVGVENVTLWSCTVGGAIDVSGTPDAPIHTVFAPGIEVRGNLDVHGQFVTTCDFSGSVIDGDVQVGLPDDPFVLGAVTSTDRSELKLVGATVRRSLIVAVRSERGFPIDLEQAEHRVRAVGLLSHPGWSYAEASFSAPGGSSVALVAFLYRPDGRHRIVILDGSSARIHELNERQPPALETADAVRQYLSLFCNNVWGDEGAFVLVAGPEDTGGEALRVLGREKDGSWSAEGTVEYGSQRFAARFRILPSGEVEMTDDEALDAPHERHAVRYDAPLRWVQAGSAAANPWPLPAPLAFGSTLARAAGPRWSDVEDALRLDLERVQRVIDLRGMKVGALADEDGAAWGGRMKWGRGSGTVLKLSGFEYDRIVDKELRPRPTGGDSDLTGSFVEAQSGSPARDDPVEERSALVQRCDWLRAQYSRFPPTESEYRPQPYQQLAGVWRAAGNFGDADAIAYEKLSLEKVQLRPDPGSNAWRRSWHRVKQRTWQLFVQLPFGFGLKPMRAVSVFLSFWLAGVLAVFALAGDLKIDASPVGTVASSQGGSERVVVEEAQVQRPRAELACGNRISKIVYPLDVMLPLIDLREESRCQFSLESRGWGAAKGFYAIFGWVVTSGLIVTLSGVVRRRIET